MSGLFRAACSALDFAGFADLARDATLSKYEKIGFPDAYRAGFEAAIFADICSKLPRMNERSLTVLDIGPGCSDLPGMIIDRCRENGHALHLIDSAEMLALIPEQPFIERHVGLFPTCSRALSHLSGTVDIAICYSVFHYVFAEADVFAFVDTMREWLAPGGACLIGDIPNQSKRDRFFASEAGKAFHKAFTGPTPNRLDTLRLNHCVRRLTIRRSWRSFRAPAPQGSTPTSFRNPPTCRWQIGERTSF